VKLDGNKAAGMANIWITFPFSFPEVQMRSALLFKLSFSMIGPSSHLIPGNIFPQDSPRLELEIYRTVYLDALLEITTIKRSIISVLKQVKTFLC